MICRRRLILVPLAILVVWFAIAASAAPSLPGRLSDREFWRLVTESSEPDGFFRSDNLLSNELGFQYVVPELARVTKPGRAYMGVGPEQNFTYIVATKPGMGFIVDVRRGNLQLQLMYKALFELSSDRADFVARLFARKRPAGLTSKSTAAEIFARTAEVAATSTTYSENLRAIENLLVRTHGFLLSKDDLLGLTYVYNAFYLYGPKIQYSSTSSFGGSFQPSYADLMTATDRSGVAHGYLATEENFRFLKDLESRNLLVPIVGNFGGPKAIRAVGRYLKDRNATVAAFYLSNVEQYLRQDGIWSNFCQNVAALPLDDSSTFIRSVRRAGDGSPGFGLSSELERMLNGIESCRP